MCVEGKLESNPQLRDCKTTNSTYRLTVASGSKNIYHMKADFTDFTLSYLPLGGHNVMADQYIG